MHFKNKIQKRASAIQNHYFFSASVDDGWDGPRKSTKKQVPPASLRKIFTTLDWHGHLNLIAEAILEIAPNPSKLARYSRMYTYALLREAKDPKKEFEVERFLELHRRATEYWVKEDGKKRENWDAVFISPEAEKKNLKLLRLYERVWGIERGERTSMSSMDSTGSRSSSGVSNSRSSRGLMSS